MNWRHSGFSVYAGNRIARDDKAGQEALAQHIMRNAFAEEKITYMAQLKHSCVFTQYKFPKLK